MQNDARTAGHLDPVSRFAQTLTDPVAVTLTTAANGVSDFFGGVFHARSLRLENRRLKDLIASQALYTEKIERLEKEVEYLRNLNTLPPTEGRIKVPADVIGYFPNEHRFTINVGENHGCKPGLAVVAGGGLLGIIQTVEPKKSQALLLSYPKQKIGAIVADRNPPPAGLLRGLDARTLLLEFPDPEAQVEIGDTVTTSGFSEMLPKGIPVGRVMQVNNDIEFGTLRAEVFPFASIGMVREVVVLK